MRMKLMVRYKDRVVSVSWRFKLRIIVDVMSCGLRYMIRIRVREGMS